MNTPTIYNGIPHRRFTLQEWDQRLAGIMDPHLRAWAASIIYWDIGTGEAWDTLLHHIGLYDNKRELLERTEAIIGALDSIGYIKAAERCTNRQDEEREAVEERRERRGYARFIAINAV